MGETSKNSDTAKNLADLTKDLVNKESALFANLKYQTVQDVQEVQSNYARKEEMVHKMLKLPKPSSDSTVASDYEKILDDNLNKLKQIAQSDFNKGNEASKKLTEETKTQLHDFIHNAFNKTDRKDEFTQATSVIFDNVNKKIQEDLKAKHRGLEYKRSSLNPGNVFVNPMSKTAEEMEAEDLLHQLFQDELVEFNRQIQHDFAEINLRMGRVVDQAKKAVTNVEIPQVDIGELPDVENTLNGLLSKAGQDFQRTRENMSSDVVRNQQMISNNVKYYAEKLLGKELPDNN